MKKTPAVVSVKGTLLKMVTSGHTLPPFLGGSRDLSKRFATTRRKMKTKPRMRVAQAKPTRGKSCCSMRGKITPPRELSGCGDALGVAAFEEEEVAYAGDGGGEEERSSEATKHTEDEEELVVLWTVAE